MFSFLLVAFGRTFFFSPGVPLFLTPVSTSTGLGEENEVGWKEKRREREKKSKCNYLC